jgi:predicted HTH transcriptional regulator
MARGNLMEEGLTLEFKKELAEGLEKEVVAFLNTQGGNILIGADDDGTILGLDDAKSLSLIVIDRIKNNIQPATLGLFNVEVKQAESKSYIRVIVAQGLEKPYYIKKHGMSSKGCFIRIGSQSSPMNQSMITDLYSRRAIQTLSNVLSPNQHLTFDQLKMYYGIRGFDVSGEFFLRNLGLYTDDGRFNYTAYLMSDDNGVSIKVARFRGMNKLDIIERNEFGRTCLIRSAYQVLDKLEVANATVVRVGGKAARKEIRLVDRDALREAVLNAIIHNDYILGSFPVFEIYDDRIEIVSSGGLPIGLSQEEFFKGLSHPRNRELMRIFSDMDLCEQLGSGMQKILRAYPRDIFSISDHFISVRFPYNEEALSIYREEDPCKPSGGNSGGDGGNNGGNTITMLPAEDDGLSENALTVLRALQTDGSLSQRQLSESIDMSMRTVQRALTELRDARYIVREGSPRSGTYIVLKQV